MAILVLCRERHLSYEKVIKNLEPWPWIEELRKSRLLTQGDCKAVMQLCQLQRENFQEANRKLLTIIEEKTISKQEDFLERLVKDHPEKNFKEDGIVFRGSTEASCLPFVFSELFTHQQLNCIAHNVVELITQINPGCLLYDLLRRGVITEMERDIIDLHRRYSGRYLAMLFLIRALLQKTESQISTFIYLLQEFSGLRHLARRLEATRNETGRDARANSQAYPELFGHEHGTYMLKQDHSSGRSSQFNGTQAMSRAERLPKPAAQSASSTDSSGASLQGGISPQQSTARLSGFTSSKLGRIAYHLRSLLDLVDPSQILLDLLQCDVITEVEYKEIDSSQLESGRKEGARSLVKFLLRKTDGQVDRFIECLIHSGDPHMQQIGSAMRDMEYPEHQSTPDASPDKALPTCNKTSSRDSSSESSSTISFKLLLDVANAIPDQWSCVHLAVELDLGEDAVNKVRRTTFTDGLAFEHVLQKWTAVKGEQATGRVLYNALLAIERRDLAQRFADRLLGDNHRKAFLPPVCNHFCGRDNMIASIMKLIKAQRVISLIGPPGFGKTSVAAAVGHQLADGDKTTVCYVPLRGLDSVAQAKSTITSVIQCGALQGETFRSTLQSLKKNTVLILDNAEDCIDKAAVTEYPLSATFNDLVTEILNTNQMARIIITSRVRLQPPGFRVKEVYVGNLTKKTSIKLLFNLCEGIYIHPCDAEKLVSFCGCVPLATCIAAGIMCYDKLTPEELLHDFHKSGVKAIQPGGDWLEPEKQLITMIDVAVKRLSPALQFAFHSLSLFSNPFSADAGAAVLGLSSTSCLKRQCTTTLVRRCLLEYNDEAQNFSMQPLIAQFGRENCSRVSAEGQQARRRFSFYFLKLLQEHTTKVYHCRREVQSIFPFVCLEYKHLLDSFEFSDLLEADQLQSLQSLIAMRVTECFPDRRMEKFINASNTAAQHVGDVLWHCEVVIRQMQLCRTSHQWDVIPPMASILKAILLPMKADFMSKPEGVLLYFISSLLENHARLFLSDWTEINEFHSKNSELVKDVLRRIGGSDIEHHLWVMVASFMSCNWDQGISSMTVDSLEKYTSFVMSIITGHRPASEGSNLEDALAWLNSHIFDHWQSAVLCFPTAECPNPQQPFSPSQLVCMEKVYLNLRHVLRSSHAYLQSQTTRMDAVAELPGGSRYESVRFKCSFIAFSQVLLSVGFPRWLVWLPAQFLQTPTSSWQVHQQVHDMMQPDENFLMGNLLDLEKSHLCYYLKDTQRDFGTSMLQLITGKWVANCDFPASPEERMRVAARIASVPFIPASSSEFCVLHSISLSCLDSAAETALEVSQLRFLLLNFFMDTISCSNCLKMGIMGSGIKLQACAGCKVAHYCSQRCNQQHKPRHKLHCALLRKARPHGWPLCKGKLDMFGNYMAALAESTTAAGRFRQGKDRLG